jgi:hypothetical protein
MSKPNITIAEISRCLELLRNADEPMVAADLAVRLELPGCRETRRRHVRAIVKQLRDDGAMIVATLQGGYWLTKDDALFRDYIEGRQIDAKRILADTHRKKKQLLDSKSQGFLFQQTMTGGFVTAAC